MTGKRAVRVERDYLGEVEIPVDAYYGIQTARAIKNFPVSALLEDPRLIAAYVTLKKAAALTNMSLGVLDKERGTAIVQASEEALSGKFDGQFPVDVFQAGAGTSVNMNVNEVLANRALEMLGRERGDYEYLSPNDHVNMGQSSNDTFPTASHIAVVKLADELAPVLGDLARAFMDRGEEFDGIVKSGRTHLMDAMPVTLGNEFRAYGLAIERAAERLSERREGLLEVAIGGTATGTGVNTHPEYRGAVIAELTELCGVEFRPARDAFEALQSRALLAAFSSALKELALELIRIANDLRLLGSGPTTGIAEIRVPAVQPGSSIMPGKVNPSMAECLNMVGFQVVGNDAAVGLATQAGQLELNVMVPVITYNIMQSMRLLTNYLPVFVERCVRGITADEERCRSYLEFNPALATLLSPRIGYHRAAEIVREALERRIPVADLAVEKGILTAEEAGDLFGGPGGARLGGVRS
jgi:aspartate ammonia-lyase